MPPAILAVAAAVVSGVGAGIAISSVVAGLIVGALTLGLGLITQALAPKPKPASVQPLTVTARNRTVLVRSSVEPHRTIYGKTSRVAPPVVEWV